MSGPPPPNLPQPNLPPPNVPSHNVPPQNVPSHNLPAGSPPAPPQPKSGMGFAQILGIIVLILVMVFLLENTRTVTLRLIGPEVKAPLYVAILIAAVLGALAAALLRFRRKHRKRQTSPR